MFRLTGACAEPSGAGGEGRKGRSEGDPRLAYSPHRCLPYAGRTPNLGYLAPTKAGRDTRRSATVINMVSGTVAAATLLLISETFWRGCQRPVKASEAC